MRFVIRATSPEASGLHHSSGCMHWLPTTEKQALSCRSLCYTKTVRLGLV